MGRDLLASGWGLGREGWARASGSQSFSANGNSKYSLGQDGDGLRKALLGHLETFQNKFNPENLKELRALARERDLEVFLIGMLVFGERLENSGKTELAAEIYQVLVGWGLPHHPGMAGQGPALQKIVKRAQGRLDALNGRGSAGLRAELLLGNFTKAATDYRTIVPMMAASAIYQVTKAGVVGRLALSPRANFFTQGFGRRVTASLAGFGAEVSSFTLLSRSLHQYSGEAVSWEGGALAKDLLGMGINLGIFKVAGAAGQSRTLKRFSVQPVAMFAGLLAAHRMEQALGLRPKVDGATTLTDGLASLVSLSVGGHLGRQILGRGWTQWMAELGLRGQDRAPAGRPWFQEGGRQLAFAGGPSPIQAPRQNLSSPMMLEKHGEPAANPQGTGNGSSPWRLRDYQEKMLDQIETDAKSGVSPWLAIASPMQTGKSYLIGPIIERLKKFVPEGTPFIILSMSRVITDQVLQDLMTGYPLDQIGRFDGIHKEIKPITVASVFFPGSPSGAIPKLRGHRINQR